MHELMNNRNPRQPFFRYFALSKMKGGYHQLLQLISHAYREREIGQHLPVIKMEWLQKEKALGLIALSGAMRGSVGQALLEGRKKDATQELQTWQDCFEDRFYLEFAGVWVSHPRGNLT